MSEVKESLWMWSSRAIGEQAVDEDIALPFLAASSSGDIEAVRDILSQPDSETIALKHSKIVILEREETFREEYGDREVLTRTELNLDRAIIRAIDNDQAVVLSILHEFALQHKAQVIHYPNVSLAIKKNHTASFKALADREPIALITLRMSHLGRPLDLAAQLRRVDIVARILKLGSHLNVDQLSTKLFDYINHQTLMGFAIGNPDTRILEMLLVHGAPVSRALHYAAELGRLDTIRLLIQHGADVNDQYGHRQKPSPHDPAWKPSWTPLHFAAARGRVVAMQLLESNGARPDVADSRGLTPVQILEEYEQERQAKASAVTADSKP